MAGKFLIVSFLRFMGILRRSKSASSVPVPVKSLNFAQQQRDEEVFKSVNEIEKLASGRQASEAAAKHACRMALEPIHNRRKGMLFDEGEAQSNDFPFSAHSTNEIKNDPSGPSRETSFHRANISKPPGVMHYNNYNDPHHRRQGPSVRSRNALNLTSNMSSKHTMRSKNSNGVRKSMSLGNLRRKLSRSSFKHQNALKSPRSCVDFAKHNELLASKSSVSLPFWHNMKAAFLSSANSSDRELPPQQVSSKRKQFNQSSRKTSPLYKDQTGGLFMTPLAEEEMLHMDYKKSQKPSFSTRLPSGFQIKRLFSALWKEINPSSAHRNRLDEEDLEAGLNEFACDDRDIEIFPNPKSDATMHSPDNSHHQKRMASDTTMETMIFRSQRPANLPLSPLGQVDMNSQRIRIPRPARLPSVQKKKSDETTSIYSQPEGAQYTYSMNVGLRPGISRNHIDWERMKARASLNAKTLSREQVASITKKHSDGNMEDQTKAERIRAWTAEDVASKSELMSPDGQENRMPFF